MESPNWRHSGWDALAKSSSNTKGQPLTVPRCRTLEVDSMQVGAVGFPAFVRNRGLYTT